MRCEVCGKLWCGVEHDPQEYENGKKAGRVGVESEVLEVLSKEKVSVVEDVDKGQVDGGGGIVEKDGVEAVEDVDRVVVRKKFDRSAMMKARHAARKASIGK